MQIADCKLQIDGRMRNHTEKQQQRIAEGRLSGLEQNAAGAWEAWVYFDVFCGTREACERWLQSQGEPKCWKTF
jgi:hypothetical protein